MARDKSPHVTDAEADAIVKFAVNVAATLSLPRWVISIMEEPADDDAQASIDDVDGRYVAEIRLNKEWMTYSDETRRLCITHEVCHLIHHQINHVFEDALDYMHAHEYASLMRRYRRETELMVDHLAGFLSETHKLEEAWVEAHTVKPEPAAPPVDWDKPPF